MLNKIIPTRHCERSEAIQASDGRLRGLLRFARNDGWILLICILCLPTPLLAERSHGISLASLKYSANATHFDYANPNAPKGGRFEMGTETGFDSINPFTEKGSPAPGMIQPVHPNYMYATLLRHSHDEPMSVYGYIAQDVEVGDNGGSVVFTLRKSAKFHDGSRITPDDVVATFTTFKAKGHVAYRQYYRDIIKAEKLCHNRVKFIFKDNKNRELPIIIGEMPILSHKTLKQIDISKSGLKVIMGSGPYRIKSVKQGNYIEYERVKNWWGENLLVAKGCYNFDILKFSCFKDGVTLFEAFKSGNLDFKMENLAKRWATGYDFPLLNQGEIIKATIKHHANQGFQGLMFNLRRPIFQDKRLRQALALAYDFEWANKNLFYNLYKRRKSYFENSEFASPETPSGLQLEILNKYRDKINPGFFTEPILLSDHSTPSKSRQMFHKARQLLTEAGYTLKREGGKQVLVDKNGQPVVLTLLVQTQEAVRAYGKYKQDLQNWLGIELVFKIPADTPTYARLVNAYDYDMLLAAVLQSDSLGNEQLEMWSSNAAKIDGTHNYSGIADAAVDGVIQDLVDADTQEHLVAASKALDWLLRHLDIGIPTYYNDNRWVAYKKHLKRPKIEARFVFSTDSWWSEG